MKDLSEYIGSRADMILRSTVPERFRDTTSPIASVQNYIVALENTLENLGIDIDAIPGPYESDE